jgi:hypothetical protein
VTSLGEAGGGTVGVGLTSLGGAGGGTGAGVVSTLGSVSLGVLSLAAQSVSDLASTVGRAGSGVFSSLTFN